MKTKKLTFLLALTFLFLFSGCMTYGIIANVSVFHNITEKYKGKKVVVLPFQTELESSLEFQNYKKTIENNLQKYGFHIVQEKDTSDFIAFVSYGIDEGKEELVVESAKELMEISAKMITWEKDGVNSCW